jgi:hypothetical protein
VPPLLLPQEEAMPTNLKSRARQILNAALGVAATAFALTSLQPEAIAQSLRHGEPKQGNRAVERRKV